MQETPVQLLGREDPLEKDRLPTPVFLGFSCGLAGKESTCNAGYLDLIPGFGRSPGEGKGYPLKYSDLENSTDCIVHGVTESDMTERLSLSFISWCSNKNWSDRLMAHVITTWSLSWPREWEYQTTWPVSWEICMQVRKQQLELDMEQQTGSK